MGIWDRIKGQAGAQFLDVLQWLDNTNDTVVWRFPIHDQAITDQSKVIVREGQAAVFVAEGQLSEVFGPGTYTLDTANQPITSFFRTIAYALENPYKGDVLFVSTRQFTANGWGTQNPFMMRDAEFGPVRVRAFGTFSFRVTDPATFIRQIVGTDGRFTTDEITGQLKKRVVAAFTAAVAQAKVPVLDLAAHYTDLGDKIAAQMNPGFQSEYGLTLTDFTIGNISLPPEVEQALDTRSRMGILGDLNAYTRLQAADALQAAASNPGVGGAGVGLGMGVGVGGMMSQMLGQATAAPGTFNPQTGMGGAPTPPPVPGSAVYHYNGPTGQAQLSAAQIAARVQGDPDADHLVWAAGWPSWKSWKDVPEVAGQLPPPVAAPPPAPATTYLYHGAEGQQELSLAAVVAAVRAAPEGGHHVWRPGWPAWKPAAEVPEIAARLGVEPPPMPGSDGPPPPPSA
ncbi:MAG: SPFH domain-containing protein [Alphaproteobacteria bacterium]|nr:SPFH domain-containing protein [Alphaproteobacteria bacterium]